MEFPPKHYQVSLSLTRKDKLPKCQEILIISAGDKNITSLAPCRFSLWVTLRSAGIEITLARSPMVTGFGLGRVELIENHLFFTRLASEEFVSSTSNVTCLLLNIAYV